MEPELEQLLKDISNEVPGSDRLGSFIVELSKHIRDLGLKYEITNTELAMILRAMLETTMDIGTPY